MLANEKSSSTKARFLVVGGINTAIDFGILFLLKALGLPAVSANLIATTTAFCFSFFANKKYTFRTSGTNVKREVVLFVVVTLFGLWVLQTLVIQGVLTLLSDTSFSQDMSLLVAKICATVVSLIWNYTLYSRLVFKQN